MMAGVRTGIKAKPAKAGAPGGAALTPARPPAVFLSARPPENVMTGFSMT